jgi:hypothetical protein
MPKFVARKETLPATLAIADITELEDPLWDTFQIRITPTMIVFRDGVAAERFDGKRFVGLREADLDRLRRSVTPTADIGPAAAGPRLR